MVEIWVTGSIVLYVGISVGGFVCFLILVIGGHIIFKCSRARPSPKGRTHSKFIRIRGTERSLTDEFTQDDPETFHQHGEEVEHEHGDPAPERRIVSKPANEETRSSILHIFEVLTLQIRDSASLQRKNYLDVQIDHDRLSTEEISDGSHILMLQAQLEVTTNEQKLIDTDLLGIRASQISLSAFFPAGRRLHA